MAVVFLTVSLVLEREDGINKAKDDLADEVIDTFRSGGIVTGQAVFEVDDIGYLGSKQGHPMKFDVTLKGEGHAEGQEITDALASEWEGEEIFYDDSTFSVTVDSIVIHGTEEDSEDEDEDEDEALS